MLELASGTQVDRYTILRPLGAGGLAVVYLARHDQIGSLHAIKVLTVPTRTVRDRLLQEGRVQGVLRHPNLVAVTDVVEVEGSPALVLEYVSGPSLATFLERTRPTVGQIGGLVRGVLRGMAAAHREGLVHRDLKPANILLEPSDGELVPKVTDFGLAKLLASGAGDGATRSGVTMGTPAYMAPEQVRDSGTVDARADVFALGAVLYELVSGRRAFVGADTFEVLQAVAVGRYAPLSEVAPDVPAPWREAIDRALQLSPADRFADAHELGAAWSRGAHSLPPEAVVWDPEALALASTLGSGDQARLSSGGPVPSADTVALSVVSSVASVGTASSGPSGGASASSPAPPVEEPASRWSPLVAALVAVAIGLPFVYGATTTASPEIPALLGARYPLLIALGLCGLGAIGAIADLTLRRRATVALWGWFVPPAVIGVISQAGTFFVTVPLDERPGAVADRAERLAQGLQVATAVDCTAQIVLAVMFGAISACGAAAVLLEAGPPKRVEPRQLAIGAVALIGGSAVWLGAIAHVGSGSLPFLVFVILCLAAVDLGVTTRTVPPGTDAVYVRRHQLLVVLATVASVLASSKSAILDEQLYLFSTVVAEAPMDRFAAAEQTAAAFDPMRSLSIWVGWEVVSLVMGFVAVKGELARHLRAFARELAPVFVLTFVVIGLDVLAFGGRMRGSNALLPAFLEESIDMQLGLSVHEDEDGRVTVDADQGELRAGDVIKYVQGRQVAVARDVAVASRECACGTPTASACDPCVAPADPLTFTVDRAGRKVEVAVPRVP